MNEEPSAGMSDIFGLFSTDYTVFLDNFQRNQKFGW